MVVLQISCNSDVVVGGGEYAFTYTAILPAGCILHPLYSEFSRSDILEPTRLNQNKSKAFSQVS